MANISVQPGSVMMASGREYNLSQTQLWVTKEVVIDSTARDSGNSPTTTMRKGVVLAEVTATGEFKEYDDTDSDGTQTARGILDMDINLLDEEGTAQDAIGVRMTIVAHVDYNALFGIDANGANDLASTVSNVGAGRRGALIIFENDQ